MQFFSAAPVVHGQLPHLIERTRKRGNGPAAPCGMGAKGKQTVRQLIRQGAGVSSIEITDKNIKPFQAVARKYGVDFALKKRPV